jgi:hypothetical protein
MLKYIPQVLCMLLGVIVIDASGYLQNSSGYDILAIITVGDLEENRTTTYIGLLYDMSEDTINREGQLIRVDSRRLEASYPIAIKFVGLDVSSFDTIWYDNPIDACNTEGFISHVNYYTRQWSIEEVDVYDGCTYPFGFFSLSPDGRYYYFHRCAPHDVYRFEQLEEDISVNSEVWFPPFMKTFIYRYDTENKSWERLTYNWRNLYPVISSDGLFLVYNRWNESSLSGDRIDIEQSIFCRSDGWLKVEFERTLGIDIINKYNVVNEPSTWPIKASLSRVYSKIDNGTYTYILAALSENNKRDDNFKGFEYPEWVLTRFDISAEYALYDYGSLPIVPGSGFDYEVKAEVVDLGIPFDEFDYVLDVRFRSDGRYVSLVGVKDEVRKLYIYDMEEEELHEVEGSEGALTARWLEIIE